MNLTNTHAARSHAFVYFQKNQISKQEDMQENKEITQKSQRETFRK